MIRITTDSQDTRRSLDYALSRLLLEIGRTNTSERPTPEIKAMIELCKAPVDVASSK